MWIWAAQGGVTNTSNPPRLSCFYITQTRACEFNNINVLTHTYIDGAGWQKHPWVGNRSSPVCVPCLLQTHSCWFYPPKAEGGKRQSRQRKKEHIPSNTDGLFSHLYNTFCTGKTLRIHTPTHANLFFLYASVKKNKHGGEWKHLRCRYRRIDHPLVCFHRKSAPIEARSMWRPAQQFLIMLSENK